MLKEEATAVSVSDRGADSSSRPATVAEIELKLLASKAALAELRAAPVIQRHACNGGTVRRLEAVYYDTPDHALYRHGLCLRVRRHGRSYVQSLKRSPISGQPLVRGEWEAPVDSMAPDLKLLPAEEVGPLINGLTAETLEAVFATKVRRRTQRLDFAGTRVELAFDEGCIEAGERSEPLIEIEIEMKSGDQRALYDLGLELIETTPLRIGTRSKADRGYDLAFGLAPPIVKATSPSLAPDCTVDDVIAMLLGACQHQVLVNQAAAEAGRDPEGVHQMRVALRRLRTAFKLLSRELDSPALRSFDDDAKWLAQSLGSARDWDVFITETLAAPSEALGAEMDFDVLRRAAEPLRQAAYAHLREALASQRYNRGQLSLLRWIESRGWRNELAGRSLAVLLEPGQAFASRALGQLHRKALRRGRHFRHLPPEKRHKVRIALKNLRYALEFFQHLYGAHDAAKQYARCVAELQDALGHENDVATTLPRLHALGRGAEIERGIGAVMGWQTRDRIEAARTSHRLWRRFKAMSPIWEN